MGSVANISKARCLFIAPLLRALTHPLITIEMSNSDVIVAPIVHNTLDRQEDDAVPNLLFATLAHPQMSRHIPSKERYCSSVLHLFSVSILINRSTCISEFTSFLCQTFCDHLFYFYILLFSKIAHILCDTHTT